MWYSLWWRARRSDLLKYLFLFKFDDSRATCRLAIFFWFPSISVWYTMRWARKISLIIRQCRVGCSSIHDLAVFPIVRLSLGRFWGRNLGIYGPSQRSRCTSSLTDREIGWRISLGHWYPRTWWWHVSWAPKAHIFLQGDTFGRVRQSPWSGSLNLPKCISGPRSRNQNLCHRETEPQIVGIIVFQMYS